MANHSYIRFDGDADEGRIEQSLQAMLNDWGLDEYFELVRYEDGERKWLIEHDQPFLNQILWVNGKENVEIRHGHNTYFARWMCYLMEHRLLQDLKGTLYDDGVGYVRGHDPTDEEQKVVERRIQNVRGYLQLTGDPDEELLERYLENEKDAMPQELLKYYA